MEVGEWRDEGCVVKIRKRAALERAAQRTEREKRRMHYFFALLKLIVVIIKNRAGVPVMCLTYIA